MPSDWSKHRFQTLIDSGDLEIGDGYRAKNSELGGQGPIFLRAGHVQDTYIDFNGAERFHSGLESKVASKMSRTGDVVVTTKGNSTGRASFVTEEMPSFVYSPHLSYWRSRNDAALSSDFLRFWAKGPEFKEQLAGMAASTDMAPYLSLVDQKRLHITLPPIDQQIAIGDILGALQDRIDWDRRANLTLEAIAAAIFKSWFVDFDPIKAKAEGREPQSMDAATAALFPSEFQDSELGPIPKGWRPGELADGIQVNPARSLRKGEIAPYLDMSNVPTAGPSASEVIARPLGSGCKFVNGDTLLAKITPCLENGKTALVDFLKPEEVGWGSTELIVLSPIPPIPDIFGYLLARDPGFRTFAERSMTGTSGRQRVPPDHLKRFRMVFASDGIYRAFDALATPMFRSISANAAQMKTLASLRDTLLPRLISGKLRVPEAEEMLAEVV